MEQSFQTGYTGLTRRWMAEGSVEKTITENDRWDEIKVVASQMSPLDWLIGKGADAQWRDVTFIYGGGERPVVHFSYMDFIFRGGIGLLIIMLFPLIWAYRAFRRSRDPLTLGAAASVLVVYLSMASANQIDMNLNWLLIALCMGRCFWATQNHVLHLPSKSNTNHRAIQ
jgi:hypothetical protein